MKTATAPALLPNYQKLNLTVVEVDTETAERWLTHNNSNRKLSEAKVLEFATDMVDGRWIFNGEPIQFSWDGTLLNGQHRLNAVILSGETQRFVVVRGLPAESQKTMDQGYRRSPADQLAIAKIESDNSTAAAVRIYIRWTSGQLFGDQKSNKITTTQIVQWAENHIDSMTLMHRWSSSGQLASVPLPKSFSLAIVLRLSEIDSEDAWQFVGLLSTGIGLSASSPIRALRERLLRDRADRTKLSDRDILGLTTISWNAYRSGRPLSKVQRPRGGGFTASTFPEPK